MSSLKAGFARMCITPPLGIDMAGYYIERKARGILDDLYVNAVAFEQDGVRTVLLSVDILYFVDEYSNRYRALIAERCSLPMEAVFLMATHTHTGPQLGRFAGTSGVGMPLYEEWLGTRLADVAVLAMEDLQPARLRQAEGEAKDVAFIRRFRMKDGSVRTNPGIGNPDIAAPLADVDEAVTLVAVERACADDLYMVNFGVHADVVHGEYISADWPGFVRRTVEKAIPGVKCVCFTRFQGDVNHIDVRPVRGKWDVRDGYERSRHIGRTVAGAVLQACGRLRPVEGTGIAYGARVITLPSYRQNERIPEVKWIYDLHQAGRDDEISEKADMERVTLIAEATRIMMLENGPDSFDFLLSAVRIGGMVLAGVPGDPFTEIGTRIRRSCSADALMLCCFVNGGSTYFPTSSAYDEGGYEARTSKLRRGADDVIVRELTGLIESLNEGNREG